MDFLCLMFLTAYSLVAASGELFFNSQGRKYDPTWDSLDSRPLPKWYGDAKFGIFIHWGVYSVPSFGTEWFWSNWKISNDSRYVKFMEHNYPPNFTYQDFARDFTAEFFDPDKWVDLFAAAGARTLRLGSGRRPDHSPGVVWRPCPNSRITDEEQATEGQRNIIVRQWNIADDRPRSYKNRYVVLTSKHHEGYTLWPSKSSFSWNAKDVGPNRDLVGDLASSLRKRHPNIKFGLYHSLYEWFNRLYLRDKGNNFRTRDFVKTKTIPELYDLVMSYEPEIIWSDGDWEAKDDYWTAKDFIAWLYNESPVRDTVVTNDRWGQGTLCKHGDFYTCADRFSPGVLQSHKWENCLTIDRRSWGFRRNASLAEYMTPEELIEELVKTVSCGGNVLMNVGPTKDGIITPIYEERLRQIGSWLQTNGEAIYHSQPWKFQNDTFTQGVWYTKNGNYVYASVLFWPHENYLILGAPKLQIQSEIVLLGYSGGMLPWDTYNNMLRIQLPPLNQVKSNWAYVFKISGISK